MLKSTDLYIISIINTNADNILIIYQSGGDKVEHRDKCVSQDKIWYVCLTHAIGQQ